MKFDHDMINRAADILMVILGNSVATSMFGIKVYVSHDNKMIVLFYY